MKCMTGYKTKSIVSELSLYFHDVGKRNASQNITCFPDKLNSPIYSYLVFFIELYTRL